MNIAEISPFAISFLTGLLWSEVHDDIEDNGITDEHDIYDIDPETLASLLSECSKFCEENGEHFDVNGTKNGITPEEQAGHDFAMTRNGHGCGFWDGDWPEPEASILDDASKAAGEVNLYVGDDGKIYS